MIYNISLEECYNTIWENFVDNYTRPQFIRGVHPYKNGEAYSPIGFLLKDNYVPEMEEKTLLDIQKEFMVLCNLDEREVDILEQIEFKFNMEYEHIWQAYTPYDPAKFKRALQGIGLRYRLPVPGLTRKGK